MATAIPTSSARNPGPWHLAKDRSDRCLYVADIHGEYVAFPYGPVSNARLMAAAPDLLDACRTVLEDARAALAGEWDPSPDGFRAQAAILERVIAQAAGQ